MFPHIIKKPFSCPPVKYAVSLPAINFYITT
jgi:hypothetical protein